MWGFEEYFCLTSLVMAKLNTAVLTPDETKKVHISIVIILSIRAFPGHYKNQSGLVATFYQTFTRCNTFHSRLNTPERYCTLNASAARRNDNFFLFDSPCNLVYDISVPLWSCLPYAFSHLPIAYIFLRKKTITLCNITNIFIWTFSTVANIQHKQYFSENACFLLQVKPLILRKIWDLRSSGILHSV